MENITEVICRDLVIATVSELGCLWFPNQSSLSSISPAVRFLYYFLVAVCWDGMIGIAICMNFVFHLLLHLVKCLGRHKDWWYKDANAGETLLLFITVLLGPFPPRHGWEAKRCKSVLDTDEPLTSEHQNCHSLYSLRKSQTEYRISPRSFQIPEKNKRTMQKDA